MKEFDAEELAVFNGSKGNPVYVAYQGKVFDVSKSKLWETGLHMNRHKAGSDLTVDIGSAPHGVEVLERCPQVGVLKKKEVVERELPKVLAKVLAEFPMLRRHPHPMVVHFPIVFSFSTAFFTLLYLATEITSFESTALHCMGAGILLTPAAIVTGWFTWWLNYLTKPLMQITIKIRFSVLLMIVFVLAFFWRIMMPDILTSFRGISALYVLLVLSLIPLVTVIGWFGATLTFPVDRH